ncbi:hypothetical protein [Caminicella sporogenes]|uniref:hypothetical protein n=1 Tax=Caminicella sporogenes TaxID=166485 RepID=UPI0025410408|nr:hypothetical protein [Caminicella sporogenes]WIF95781.1 hypothetical protein QNI18_03970 [Caminicella sporogenes]
MIDRKGRGIEVFYKKGKFCLNCDFDIRVIREDENDTDLFIPVENRTVNLYFEDFPSYLKSRVQFLMVRNIIIRFCSREDNNACTVHLLRNIDLQSAHVNFEINYENHIIEIIDKEYFIDMKIKEKINT